MKKKICWNPKYHEFNYYTESNFLIQTYPKEYFLDKEISIFVSNPEFLVCFNNFDIVHTILPEDNIITNPPFDSFIHPYVRNFSLITKIIQEKKLNYFRPFEKDYLEIRQQLKNIDIPIVCVHGRNLSYTKCRNNLHEQLIQLLLDKGCFVINTTIEAPNLPFLESYKYRYIETGKETYSRTLSWFLNSNICFLNGTCAGISNHLCSEANICAILSDDPQNSWINHIQSGYNNKTLLESRKELLPNRTFSYYFNGSGFDLNLINISKIEIEKFFKKEN